MRCRRVNIVVRRQPPQLSRSLKSIRDRSDPLEVLVLASRRIVDLIDILDHRRNPSISAATPKRAPTADAVEPWCHHLPSGSRVPVDDPHVLPDSTWRPPKARAA